MALGIDQHYENIFLVEEKETTLPSDIKATLPGWKICVCDLEVIGSQDGELDPSYAVEFENLLIIDHHMKKPIMHQFISSAMIANSYVRLHGPLSKEYAIVINHVDSDSILSALIMNGTLQADDILGQAAQHADHFGGINIISDLLQSMEEDRNLRNSIEITPLLPILHHYLRKRYAQREEIQGYIRNGLVHWEEGLACLKLDHLIDEELLPNLLPEAKVILYACPMQDENKKKWRIRIRLGQQGEDLNLAEMNLPEYVGPWNAGSIARETGTDTEPEDYLRLIAEAIKRA
jgi:hypothetical protein